ncbi:carboxyltransferase domain-containing protein [Rhodobacter capsulatus]|uniref:Sensor histidine kinase inhibitor, KipI family n=1 Tax=Rhodobacter capsulatus TaxID=1061 RepID=A0A1G7JFB2_RHOCA|nr:carboxyltransferase domain-containing protein [Rhodobacter capsulatus]WER07822.1 carboxyltransferase domain-containing protein [Rhodobacter capsulatus]SDF23484.1 sensor histidine kinase inhibitor, KipI family [Rhodobacter capsulatus]
MSLPEILPLGLDALLVRFSTTWSEAANTAAQRLAAALSADPLPGQTEVAPGLGSALLRFDRLKTTRAAIVGAMRDRLDHAAAPEDAARHWLVPACFGGVEGPQLAAAAALAGRSETALISELCATNLRVLALGFAPGQPYLGTLPAHWQMPRLPALTPRVAAGTITTALCQIVLFAAPSPTGWRALGRTAFRPFSATAAEPFHLRPGDFLRFTPTSAENIAMLIEKGDPLGGAIRSFPK